MRLHDEPDVTHERGGSKLNRLIFIFLASLQMFPVPQYSLSLILSPHTHQQTFFKENFAPFFTELPIIPVYRIQIPVPGGPVDFSSLGPI